MKIYMETTNITPEKTVSEINAVLMRYGASAILTELEHGQIEAVSFKHKIGEEFVPFRLPCRWKNIETVLAKRGRVHSWSAQRRREALALKARRVAWRQILRWVEAQMALVETSMVKVEEVFFPYIQTQSGKTLYEIQEQGKFLALTAGGQS